VMNAYAYNVLSFAITMANENKYSQALFKAYIAAYSDKRKQRCQDELRKKRNELYWSQKN